VAEVRPGERRLRRADRLLSSRDYARVARQGERRASRHFVLLVAPQGGPDAGSGGSRLGLTVSRRVGNAVVRNRVKRRVREAFRTRRALAPAGRDLVVIARPGAGELSAADAAAEIVGLLAAGEAR
jgi:ribonuclease P protein component